MNVGCYPSVHYPEVYVLQGGYADFWKHFPVSLRHFHRVESKLMISLVGSLRRPERLRDDGRSESSKQAISRPQRVPTTKTTIQSSEIVHFWRSYLGLHVPSIVHPGQLASESPQSLSRQLESHPTALVGTADEFRFPRWET